MFSKKRCKIRKNPQKSKMKFGRKSINYQYLRLKSVMYRISQYRMFACIIVHHSFFVFALQMYSIYSQQKPLPVLPVHSGTIKYIFLSPSNGL